MDRCRTPRHGDGCHAGGATGNDVGDRVSYIDAPRGFRVEKPGRIQQRFRIRLVSFSVISSDEHIDP
jgi:hypothetical protein